MENEYVLCEKCPETTLELSRVCVRCQRDELRKAAQDLLSTIGENGYFPSAGEPKTTALREAVANSA